MSHDTFGKTLLMKQFKELTKNPVDGFSVGLIDDDIYRWKILMEGPDDTPFEGGYFPCTLTFGVDYPQKPPVMTFTCEMWHPNVYYGGQNDGMVCISILHEAKEDAFNPQELMTEKWRPILGVDAILLSVQSLLSEPNTDSPANVDAAIQMRNDREAYNKRVRAIVRKGLDTL